MEYVYQRPFHKILCYFVATRSGCWFCNWRQSCSVHLHAASTLFNSGFGVCGFALDESKAQGGQSERRFQFYHGHVLLDHFDHGCGLDLFLRGSELGWTCLFQCSTRYCSRAGARHENCRPSARSFSPLRQWYGAPWFGRARYEGDVHSSVSPSVWALGVRPVLYISSACGLLSLGLDRAPAIHDTRGLWGPNWPTPRLNEALASARLKSTSLRHWRFCAKPMWWSFGSQLGVRPLRHSTSGPQSHQRPLGVCLPKTCEAS